MNIDKRIALISVHGDPAIDIGKEEAGGDRTRPGPGGGRHPRQGKGRVRKIILTFSGKQT